MAQVVILLGAPGAGKGTQAQRLARDLGLPHIATGDLFRENLGKGTELGRRAQVFMDAGKLVPDDLVVDMLFDRVARPDCAGGYLLDGFPRTLNQAEVLARRLDPSWTLRVADIDVADEEIVVRIAGRLVCKACGNVQHARYSPPKQSGVCDACGGELYRRKDDDPHVLRQRLDVYRAQTAPLLDYYRAGGRLCSVDGSRSPDHVFQDLKRCVGGAA